MIFDDIYRSIGEFGHYQAFLYFLLAVICVPSAWQNVAITFLGAKMPHACAVPQLAGLSFEQQRYIAIPYEDKNNKSTYEKCLYYDLDYTVYDHEDLLGWNREAVVTNTTKIPCDNGWIYDYSVFVDSAVSEWNLVCSQKVKVNLVQSVYMGGVVVGCIVFGQLSDIIGRLKTLSLCSLLWSASAVGASFSHSYDIFLFLRFVVGACSTGAYTAAFVLAMETAGPSIRVILGIIWQGWFSLGIMSLSLISYLVRDFHKLQIVIGAMPVIFVSYNWLFQESPRWLVAKCRDADAEVVLHRMAEINRRELPYRLHLEDNREVSTTNEDSPNPLYVRYTFLDLFRTPQIRKTTIQMWIAWFSISMVYYGLSLGVSFLEGSSLFVNNFVSGVVEIPTFFLTIIALRKIGRRWTNVVAFFGSAISCFIAIPFVQGEDTDSQSAMLTCLAIGKAFSAAGFATLYVYAAELYPTPLRTIGIGAASMFARCAGLLQPQVELLNSSWGPAPFVVYGLISIAGGTASIFFPETRDRKFPETVEEAENYRKNAALDGRVVVANVNPTWRLSRTERSSTSDSITSRF